MRIFTVGIIRERWGEKNGGRWEEGWGIFGKLACTMLVLAYIIPGPPPGDLR